MKTTLSEQKIFTVVWESNVDGEFLVAVYPCDSLEVAKAKINFPTEEFSMDDAIELNKNTWIDSIAIINGKCIKVHYDDPALENIGLSSVDWNDIATEVKLKILKAIGYHEN